MKIHTKNRNRPIHQEVVKIIGALPGQYGRPEGVTLVPCGPDGRCLDERNPQVAVIVWTGKDVAIRVRFSREGKVVGKMLVPVIYFD